MPRQIVVEGPDGSGKSTLVHYLIDHFHQLELVKIFNHEGPKSKAHLRARYLEVMTNVYQPHIVPIFDRFYFSELIYGSIIRGEVALASYEIDRIAEAVRREGLVIYCRPSDKIIHESVASTLQMVGVTEHLDEIIHAYDVLMTPEGMGGRYIQYDWTTKGDLAIVEQLVDSYLNGWIWSSQPKG